jgi:lipopolysaccharide export system permease protein
MKTYIKFLINLFNISFLRIFFIFFGVILLTNILEQAEFFKNSDLSFTYQVFLAFLNSPSILFEILPFIFLISTQVFFINLINNNELEIFKYNGLSNQKILKIISVYSFLLGVIFVIFFYNMSAFMKNSYLLIKNKYADDGKYLAVINKNGLWIKDEIGDQINIINASKIKNEFLLNVSISQFSKNFEIIRTIQTKKVNISKIEWIILSPTISKDNIITTKDEIKMRSNFDLEKINSLFSNMSSLGIMDLLKLRKNYKSLNYSIVSIDAQLYKIISYPLYLTLMTMFSAVIMYSIGYQKRTIYKIILGIFISVIVYYINYFFNILGTSERIPVILSIILPLIILSIINMISIIKLNEK